MTARETVPTRVFRGGSSLSGFLRRQALLAVAGSHTSRAAALSLPAARIVIAAAGHEVHAAGPGHQTTVSTTWNAGVVQPGPAVALLHNWLASLQHAYDWTAHNHAVMRAMHGGFAPSSTHTSALYGGFGDYCPHVPYVLRGMHQSPLQHHRAPSQHFGDRHTLHVPTRYGSRGCDAPGAGAIYENVQRGLTAALEGAAHGSQNDWALQSGNSDHVHYGGRSDQLPASQMLSGPHMTATGGGSHSWSQAPPGAAARAGRGGCTLMLPAPAIGQPPASVLRLLLDGSQHEQLLPAIEEALNAASGELGAPLTVQRKGAVVSVSIQRDELFDWLESPASAYLASTGMPRSLEQLRAKPAVVDSLQMWMSEEEALRQWLAGEAPHFPRKAQNTAEVLGMTMSQLNTHASALRLPAHVKALAMHALCVLLTHVNPSGSCVGDMEAVAAAMRPPAHAVSGNVAAGAPVVGFSAGNREQDSMPVAGGAANSPNGMQTAFMSTSTTLSNAVAQVSGASNAVTGSDSCAVQRATSRDMLAPAAASARPAPSHSSSWMWNATAGSVATRDSGASTVWGTKSGGIASDAPSLSWVDLHSAGSGSRLESSDPGESANASQRSVAVRSASVASSPAISGPPGALHSGGTNASISGAPSGARQSSGTSGLSQRLTGSSQASQLSGGAHPPQSHTPPTPLLHQDMSLARRSSSASDANAAPTLPPLPPRSGARISTVATAATATAGNHPLQRRSPTASSANGTISTGAARVGSDVLVTAVTASSISGRTSCHAATASLTSAFSDTAFPVDPVFSGSQPRLAISADVSQHLSKQATSSGGSNFAQGTGSGSGAAHGGDEGRVSAGLDLSEINATADALRAVSIRDGGIQGEGPAPPTLDTVIEVGSHSSRSATSMADNACKASGSSTLTDLQGASSSQLGHVPHEPIAGGVAPLLLDKCDGAHGNPAVHAHLRQVPQQSSHQQRASHEQQPSTSGGGEVAGVLRQVESLPPDVHSACQRLAELCCAAASTAGPWPPFFLAQVCAPRSHCCLVRLAPPERLSWSCVGSLVHFAWIMSCCAMVMP